MSTLFGTGMVTAQGENIDLPDATETTVITPSTKKATKKLMQP